MMPLKLNRIIEQHSFPLANEKPFEGVPQNGLLPRIISRYENINFFCICVSSVKYLFVS